MFPMLLMMLWKKVMTRFQLFEFLKQLPAARKTLMLSMIGISRKYLNLKFPRNQDPDF